MSWFRSNNRLIVRCMMRCMRMHVLEQSEIFHNIRILYSVPHTGQECSLQNQNCNIVNNIYLYIYIYIFHLYLILENYRLAFR